MLNCGYACAPSIERQTFLKKIFCSIGGCGGRQNEQNVSCLHKTTRLKELVEAEIGWLGLIITADSNEGLKDVQILCRPLEAIPICATWR